LEKNQNAILKNRFKETNYTNNINFVQKSEIAGGTYRECYLKIIPMEILPDETNPPELKKINAFKEIESWQSFKRDNNVT
jgi:hypothetical protein